MSELLDEADKLMRDMGFPDLSSMDTDRQKLIALFMQTNDPKFLMGLIFKLMASENDTISILADYLKLREEYVKFKKDASNAINEHTKILKHHKTALEFLKKEYDDSVRNMMSESEDSPPRKH